MSQTGRYFVDIEAISGNSGGPVEPNNGDITLVGTAPVTVTGNPATSTLTIALAGSVPTSFPTDTGTAVPALGVLNMYGTHNISTTGVGNTITTALDNTVVLGDIAPVIGDALTITTGNETITAGDLNITLGNINMTAGDLTLSAGDVSVTGSLAVSTLTDHGILIGHGASNITSSTLTDGQLLIGKTGAFDPVAASLTPGAGISITPGAGSITIASTITQGIVTINGDSGSATGTTVTLDANTNSGSSVKFTGAAATVSLSTTDALNNTIIGSGAGNLTGTGTVNTALGRLALPAFTSGLSNTAIGTQSLQGLTTGLRNTAVGNASAFALISGTDNICLGVSAGGNYTGAETDNICIGNGGIVGDTGVIRIGRPNPLTPTQTSCYIAGIDTVNVGSVATVVTEANNKLGTAVITAGTGITVTPGANTITITNSAPFTPFTWAVTTVDASLVANNGYIADKVGLLTMTLPATGTIGDTIEITNINTAVGWRIAQNANQYIRLGTSLTTTGIAGYLEATALGDSVKLVCTVAGASTGWQIVSSMGNITIA